MMLELGPADVGLGNRLLVSRVVRLIYRVWVGHWEKVSLRISHWDLAALDLQRSKLYSLLGLEDGTWTYDVNIS